MPVYLHVELDNTEPLIWRQLVVPNAITLDELHIVIQGAFAWHNTHLHAFYIGDQRYEVPGPDGDFIIEDAKDERKTALADIVRKGTKIEYEYDFGDGWEHTISVQKVEKPKRGEDSFIPYCSAGEMAGPPEDCGGIPGYYNLVDALADKKHPAHKEIKDWAPGYDPAAFSIWQANALIAALYVWEHERKGKPLGPQWI